MTIELRVLLFTGLANPSVILEGREAEALAAQLQRLQPLQARIQQEPYPRLGYRGVEIIVRDDDRHIRSRTVVYYGAVFDPARVTLLDDRARVLEHQVFQRVAGTSFQGLEKLTWATVDQTGNETTIGGLESSPTASPSCENGPTTPASKPWAANMTLNNCYNYANDVLNTDDLASPAMPGHLAGRGPGDRPTFKQLVHGEVVSDDLVALGESVPAVCPSSGHHVIVVMMRDAHRHTSQLDYHCVRLDKNGHWSHFDASGMPRMTDDAGRQIDNITTAVFDGSPELIGVYMALADNPKIK